jgi:tetratricopeptide (TPR) repeat protein
VAVTALICCVVGITNGVTANTIANIRNGNAMAGIDPRISKDYLDKADRSPFIYDRSELSRQYTALAVRVAARRQFAPEFVHSLLDGAVSATRRALGQVVNDEELWLALTHLYFLRAKYDQVPVDPSVEQPIRAAMEFAPNRVEPWEYMARYRLEGNVVEAGTIADHILKVAPKRAQSNWIRALVYRQEGNDELALKMAKAAVDFGYHPELCTELAWLIEDYLRLRNYSAVIPLYQACVDLDQQDSRSYAALAGMLAEVGDTAGSRNAWERWTICDYLEKHEYRKLGQLYERALFSNGTNSALYESLARVYLELGEKEKARLAAERAAELNPALDYQLRVFLKILR